MKTMTHWKLFPEKNPIPLWENPPAFDPALGQDPPTLTPYLIADGKTRGCVIVFPGGGYAMKAYHEAEPIARWLNRCGVHSFVLDYRVTPYHHPVPLQDARRAVRLVRSRAAQWGVDPDHIAVLGFSAGGHLAACLATMFDDGDPAAQDPVERFSCRPDAALLCYAVLDIAGISGPLGHEGSWRNLIGDRAIDEQLARELSPFMQVTPRTPPLFLWHTAADEAVPVENSLKMAAAARQAGVDVELHVYPHGRHGLGLARRMDAGRWTQEARAFLTNLDFSV